MNYLILQYPYNFIEIALCHNGSIIASAQEDKLHAITRTVPLINKLLKNQNWSIQNIDFIGVNTGPGPYNTLRSLITTANGIHFAQNTPLINLQAIDLLLSESSTPSLAILNAFANHVFYGFKTSTNNEQGYCSINTLITKINQHHEKLLLIGNAAQLHQTLLEEKAKKQIIFPNVSIPFNSLQTLAQHAYKKANLQEFAPSYLLPQYLQSPAIK